jgi:hypothetical protein
MTNVYSIDVKVWATAYIKAETPEAAAEIVRKLRRECLQMPEDNYDVGDDRVPVCEMRFDHSDFPELSLATNMTVDATFIDNIKANELELVHESVLRAEADAPSCQQVHREDGSPDQA